MNLKILSDEELEVSTKRVIVEERLKTTEVLEHIREVELRRLFAKRGMSSLFEYAVKALGYSEGAAHRRIQTMRLAGAIPEIKEKLAQGALSLTIASSVQSFFEMERKEHHKSFSQSEKIELIRQLEGKSKRAAEVFLNQVSTAPLQSTPEKVKYLNENEILVQFTLDQELQEIVEEFRNLQGFQSQGRDRSYLELFKRMGRIALEATKKKKGILTKTSPAESKDVANQIINPANSQIRNNSHSRAIPKRLKAQLWQKHDSRCAYVDPKTQNPCNSRFGLQVEHIKPFALGGLTRPENLELLCPAHNQLRAVQQYGQVKMNRYLKQVL